MKRFLSLLTLIICLSFPAWAENDSISMNVTQITDQQFSLAVQLNNPNRYYTGFQMDIKLPENTSFDLTSLKASSRLYKLSLNASDWVDGWVRVVAYATLRTSMIKEREGDIFTITFNSENPLPDGEYNILAKNIRFTTSVALEFVLPGVDYSFVVDNKGEPHTLQYWVGQDLYHSEDLYAGDTIPLVIPPEAAKGYSFTGWDNLPELMPDSSIDVHAVFTPNRYAISYYVEDELFKVDSVQYGDTIPPVIPPEASEGYSFKGWNNLPELMPDSSIDVHAVFTPNRYAISYYVEDELVKVDSLLYGDSVSLFNYMPAEPEKYGFSGWTGDKYDFMPAHDLEYYGKLILLGDVNLDGSLNGADVVSIYNYIQLGDESGVVKQNADVDQDGNVNGADVVSVYNHIIGL